MSEQYCQMDIIEAGIWSIFDERTCCGRVARFHVVIWGEKRHLCAEHFDGHMETRGFLHMDGEALDANGNPL